MRNKTPTTSQHVPSDLLKRLPVKKPAREAHRHKREERALAAELAAPPPPAMPAYLRLGAIVGRNGVFPVGKTTFYALIALGRIPSPLKVGRASLWETSGLLQAIRALKMSDK